MKEKESLTPFKYLQKVWHIKEHSYYRVLEILDEKQCVCRGDAVTQQTVELRVFDLVDLRERR